MISVLSINVIHGIQISGSGFFIGAARTNIKAEWDTSSIYNLYSSVYTECNFLPGQIIRLELAYTGKGWFDKKTSYWHKKYNLKYLQMPILIKLYLNREPKPTHYILFGPAGSYLISSKYSIEGPEDNYNDFKRSGSISNMSEFDVSLMLGLGIERKRFTIEARYDIGFQQLHVYNLEGKKNRIYNRALYIIMGLRVF